MSAADISIVIPCYPPHLHYLNAILTNISIQTIQPKEVIVAISQIDNRIKGILHNQYVKKFKGVDFKIVSTVRKQLAGVNRNMGAKIATGEYVMFIDADDTIHPKKIEATKYYLDKYKPNLLLHSYVKNKPKDFLKTYELNYQSTIVVQNDVMFKSTFGDPPKRNRIAEITRNIRSKSKKTYVGIRTDNRTYAIAAGYPTVKRSLFSKYQYVNMGSGEDGVFDRDILWNEGKVIFINLPLLNYRHP